MDHNPGIFAVRGVDDECFSCEAPLAGGLHVLFHRFTPAGNLVAARLCPECVQAAVSKLAVFDKPRMADPGSA
jgi:hypothetical protein